jgi:hypothetical protein
MRGVGSDCRSPLPVQSPGAALAAFMSLLLPEYEAQLLAEMDKEGEDISAEEMTPEVRKFCDRLFMQALKSNLNLKTPKPTDIPPGPFRVAVYRQRFRMKQALFHPKDLRWDQVKARGGRKVTKRNPKNGNELEAEILDERDVLAELRADEAARKARWS